MTTVEMKEYCKELGIELNFPISRNLGTDLPRRDRSVVDMAIMEEKESFIFYNNMGSRVDNQTVARLFFNLASDELKHKALLETVKYNEQYTYEATFNDCYLDDGPLELSAPTSELQKALLLAIHWEQASVRLYLNLAEKINNPDLKRMLLAISQEEATHKRRLEAEYLTRNPGKNDETKEF